MDVGGRGKRNEKDDRRKDKGKRKESEDEEIAEEDMPRNRKYMEKEKNAGKRIKVSDDGNDCPPSWDWRNYAGVTSNVLQQDHHLICWAIAFIRAVEALFNIGQRLESQRSFSIQHLVNNIQIGAFGLHDRRTLGAFVQQNGLLDEAECSYTRTRRRCAHQNQPNIETIDGFVVIDRVDDVELARLVWQHPVAAVVPDWDDFSSHRDGIFRPREGGNIRLHAVLIVGYGIDDQGRHYWIIQNSAGTGWGQQGFGFIHREHRRGRGSLFREVYYAQKNGYPRKKKE